MSRVLMRSLVYEALRHQHVTDRENQARNARRCRVYNLAYASLAVAKWGATEFLGRPPTGFDVGPRPVN
jgi:hypothetical protein